MTTPTADRITAARRKGIRPGDTIVHVRHADGTSALWTTCDAQGVLTISDDRESLIVTADEHGRAVDEWCRIMKDDRA